MNKEKRAARLSSEQKQEFGRALALRAEFKLDQALQILLALRKKSPHSPAVLGLLGDVYWRNGQLKHAISAFREATELSPGSELASLSLFHTLIESGDVQGAHAEMGRFLRRSPSEEYTKIIAEAAPTPRRLTPKRAAKRTSAPRASNPISMADILAIKALADKLGAKAVKELADTLATG